MGGFPKKVGTAIAAQRAHSIGNNCVTFPVIIRDENNPGHRRPDDRSEKRRHANDRKGCRRGAGNPAHQTELCAKHEHGRKQPAWGPGRVGNSAKRKRIRNIPATMRERVDCAQRVLRKRFAAADQLRSEPSQHSDSGNWRIKRQCEPGHCGGQHRQQGKHEQVSRVIPVLA
jgi:hypothetical protein